MLVAVVLGNRINDDGSMSNTMLNRLKMTLRVYKTFVPTKIILSGGVANKKVNVSEAQMMRDYLVDNGIPQEALVLEDKSLTTKQNSEFSVPLAASLNADELLLCTSAGHMSRKYLNPIKLFQRELAAYPQIKLSAYCEQ